MDCDRVVKELQVSQAFLDLMDHLVNLEQLGLMVPKEIKVPKDRGVYQESKDLKELLVKLV